MQYLDHEKLEVYRLSMSLVVMIEKMVQRFPFGRAYLVDQVRRSSTSVVLNIAEGAGEHSIAEKNRFYRMAKRSATECASSMEICLHLQLIEEMQYTKAREYIIRIVAMLTKLIQSKMSVHARMPVNVPLPLPSSDPKGV